MARPAKELYHRDQKEKDTNDRRNKQELRERSKVVL